MLRFRRRGQDHDVGGAGAAGGRAGTPGLRPDDRPGAPPRPVHGPHRARQHPAPRQGRRRDPRRTARRDDARHEAHLRRGRRGALDAGEGAADPGEPVLRGTLQLVRGHAGVHGDGEARPAARRRPWRITGVGTSSSSTLRRRGRRSTSWTHPSGCRRCSTDASCGCMVAPARGPARLLSAGFGLVTSALNKVLGAQMLTDMQAFIAALDTLFGGFRQRAEATYSLLQADGTAFVVVAAPEVDAMREAVLLRRAAVGREDAPRRPRRQPHAPRRHREHHRRRCRVGGTQARLG